MNRSQQQNRIYHSYCGQLYKTKEVRVYDGRFTEYGYPNPFRFRPSALSYDSFRDIMKALDFDFKKDERGKPVSSSIISTEDMSSHIMFLEVLLIGE